MLTNTMLSKHNMMSLDWYKGRHGHTPETEKTFYETFLIQTDYVVSKISECQYLGKELDEEYQNVLQCREYCREQIRQIKSENQSGSN